MFVFVTFYSSFHWSRLLFYGSAKYLRFGLINIGGVVRMGGGVIIQGLQLALGGYTGSGRDSHAHNNWYLIQYICKVVPQS